MLWWRNALLDLCRHAKVQKFLAYGKPFISFWAPMLTQKAQLSHAINTPLCSKKGGGHKNAPVSKTLRCVSQSKLARKQNPGISTHKLALWPRKWCVSGGVSNSLRPCEMKDLFSMAQLSAEKVMVLQAAHSTCRCSQRTVLYHDAECS